jgi:sulfate permease, SulP family
MFNQLKKTFLPDLLSGIAIAVASVSTGAAFGILSGRGAFAGIVGTAVISIIVAILGGTRRQIALPTGTMSAPSALMIAFAYDSFGRGYQAEQFITLIMIMTGLFLIIGGIFNLGRFVSYIPELVVYGFANGLAGIILINQMSRLFGYRGFELKLGETRILGIETGSQFTGNILFNALICFTTLAIILLLPKITKKLGLSEKVRAILPASLLTIIFMTILTTVINFGVQKTSLGVQLNSFAEYVNLVKSYFPTMAMFTDTSLILKALPWALQLSVIAYLDTLLTSVLLDSMTGEPTKRGKELVAQGIANAISGSLGGILGAQSTVTSILALKEGMVTRLAGVITGIVTIAILALFSGYISLIALAVFAGVLLKVAWDTLDKPFFEAYFSRKWHQNPMRNWQMALVMWTAIITILIDLNVAVVTGTIIFYVLKKYNMIKDISQSDYDEVPEQHLQDVPLYD